MWLWIVIVALFLFLLSRFSRENGSSTRSRPAALIGTIADGMALIAMTAGVFGLLMSIFFGLIPPAGAHLSGGNLTAMLLWSAGLIALGVLLFIASGGVRRMGGRGRAQVQVIRGR